MIHRSATVGPWLRPAVLVAGLIGAGGVFASDLTDVMKAGTDKILLAQNSQKTIQKVVLQTDALEGEYKQVLKELDGLRVYNEYMERQVTAQEDELARIGASIDRIGSVERQIMPLMIRMLDGLERFIELDLPFLLDERTDRVTRLRALMERADVTVAEKFRRLTEAFQIENDFGRTIETYKATLEIDGATLEVDVLRLGRIGLFYQTNDASVSGRWDAAAGRWAPVGGGARNQIRQGLRIARRQVAPDLLMLDIPAPEAAR